MTLPTETLFSPNTTSDEKVTLLKHHFPQCFDKDGNFLPEKMAEQLQNANVPVSREYYTMNWLGKSYARYLRDCPPTTLLGEDTAHNTLPQNQHSQNLLIKGDNLEVLKHLKNAYANQVKMIYIDPPYNTGSDDFVFQDDRKFTPDELAELTDMSTDEARRVLDFTTKKSNSHSAWLTFMYPRLYIARELLKEDGVIFISIDDNEQAQLKLLCDEVFGEENFRNQIAVKRGTKSVQAQFDSIDKLGIAYETVLVYSKKAEYKLPKFYFELEGSKEGSWNNHWRSTDRPTMRYEILGKNIATGQWRWAKDRSQKAVESYEKLLDDLGSDPSQEEIDRWYFENGEPDLLRLSKQGKPEHFIAPTNTKFGHNLWTDLMVGKSSVLANLGINVFNNPKNPDLIIRMMKWIVGKNDLILDFFAGSGTTAHAVMQLNAEDNGNRRFICVQIDKPTDPKKEAYKAGYRTIFEITQARIEKASAKIRTENPDYQGDLGFKIFETMPDFRATDDELSPQLEFPEMLHANLEPKQYETLLTTWCVYDGNALTTPVQAVQLDDYITHLCDTTLYVVYPDFDSMAIKALLDKLDNDADFIVERIVLFGQTVASAKQRELKQALDTYNNKKNVHLSLLVRY